MQSSNNTSGRPQINLEEIQELLESGTFQQIRRTINSLAPVEIARLLASSPPPSRKILWGLVKPEYTGDVIEELSPDIQQQFLEGMETRDLVQLTEGMDADDIVDILQNLPEQVTQEILQAMTQRDRDRIAMVLPYPEDTAGGLTNPDTVTVRPRFTLDVVLRYLRRRPELPPGTDCLYVVNRNDEYLGLLPLTTLLTADTSTPVRDIMSTQPSPIPAHLSELEVAKLFEEHDWVSAPVVDQQGRLIGRITIDDVVDVITENADQSFMRIAGLNEEQDTFATVRRTVPRRAVWLGANLLTAVLSSLMISLFQDTLDRVVALAILMPIVASMGGVAGSQTLTVVIRGMTLGQIGRHNLRWLLRRECLVGLLNGTLAAAAVGILAAFWFGDTTLGLVLGIAMIVNLFTAALAGTYLPVLLKSCGVDPALAGGWTLTTVTDVVGFCSFLGLATWFLS